MERLENLFGDIETLHRNRCAGELFTRLLKAQEVFEVIDKTFDALYYEGRENQRCEAAVMVKQALKG